MIVCDSSVLIAAFARWHDQHEDAARALRRAGMLIDHVAVETFSVLTRLPAPRRAPSALVAGFLRHHFPTRTDRLPTPGSDHVLGIAERSGITGGAIYDLVVALAAAQANATLLSLDRRAARTYAAAGTDYELISPI